jgi:predicted membrane-bound mannosyltransferase
MNKKEKAALKKAQDAQLARPGKVLKTAHVPKPRAERSIKHDPNSPEVTGLTNDVVFSEEATVVADAAKKKGRTKGSKKVAGRADALEAPMKFGDIDK